MTDKDRGTIIVLLGATGDLARKKLFPALFGLYKNNKLPKNIKIVGFSRRNFTNVDFRNFLIENIPVLQNKTNDSEEILSFLELIEYSEGKFDDPSSFESLINLLKKIDGEFGNCSDKLFHLAVSPVFYKLVLENMHKTGLTLSCTDGTGKTKIIIEKPIGHDLKSSKEIHNLINKIASREQVFEIDHYLTKETLYSAKNLIENKSLKNIWNNKHIESIDVNLFETKDIEGRNEFYDSLGAIRDVGQNHALILLSHILQDETGFDTDIHQRRANILKSALKFDPVDIDNVVHAQYIGYKGGIETKENSETDTFFKFPIRLKDEKWNGIKIIISGGKALSKNEVAIKVGFKSPETFKIESQTFKNIKKVIFRIQPDAGAFFIDINNKESFIPLKGKTYAGHSSESYEKLYLEALKGNEDFFVSEEEIESAWSIIDQIREVWTKLPLIKYEKGEFPKNLQAFI